MGKKQKPPPGWKPPFPGASPPFAKRPSTTNPGDGKAAPNTAPKKSGKTPAGSKRAGAKKGKGK
jgi:hypothetical protein